MEFQKLTSFQNPLVKHLVKIRTDANYRYEHQSIVLEGIKPIREMKEKLIRICFTQEYASHVDSLIGEKYLVAEAMLHKISGMNSPEGIVAEARMPPFVSLSNAHQVLALDGISDPGNMGTLMRTALAFGWKTVYFLPKCCDPFNEKVLRAARGAHFKLALIEGTAKELRDWAEEKNVQSLVADIKGENPESFEVPSERLLVLGNEAHGASKAIREFCLPVSLKMKGDMESLNVAVAGGILLFLLSRELQN